MTFCVLLTALHRFSQTSSLGISRVPACSLCSTVVRARVGLGLAPPLLFFVFLLCASSSLFLNIIIIRVRACPSPIILSVVGAPNVVWTNVGMVPLAVALQCAPPARRQSFCSRCPVLCPRVLCLGVLGIPADSLSKLPGSLFQICLPPACPVILTPLSAPSCFVAPARGLAPRASVRRRIDSPAPWKFCCPVSCQFSSSHLRVRIHGVVLLVLFPLPLNLWSRSSTLRISSCKSLAIKINTSPIDAATLRICFCC